MAKTTKTKICPFIKAHCPKGQCEIYESKLNRCTIPVLAYNLYRLSELEAAKLEAEREEQETTTVEEAPCPVNMDVNEIFQ